MWIIRILNKLPSVTWIPSVITTIGKVDVEHPTLLEMSKTLREKIKTLIHKTANIQTHNPDLARELPFLNHIKEVTRIDTVTKIIGTMSPSKIDPLLYPLGRM